MVRFLQSCVQFMWITTPEGTSPRKRLFRAYFGGALVMTIFLGFLIVPLQLGEYQRLSRIDDDRSDIEGKVVMIRSSRGGQAGEYSFNVGGRNYTGSVSCETGCYIGKLVSVTYRKSDPMESISGSIPEAKRRALHVALLVLALPWLGALVGCAFALLRKEAT